MSLSLPAGICEVELAEGYPAMQIETAACKATLALHGAHVTQWQPAHAKHPVIYNSPTAVYREGKAIRGGIPLCWPWFNAHPSDPKTHPSHGVARNRFWQLVSAEALNGQIVFRLMLEQTDAVGEHVPFDFKLIASISFGETLEVELQTENLSSQPIPVGGALHTYLAISNIADISISGLQNTPFIDTTTDPDTLATDSDEKLEIAAEVDRTYYGTGNPVTVHDSGWDRTITIGKRNSLTTVVWNPWVEKAAALGDLPDEAYHDFLCVEAANARHDTRVVLPNKTHSLVTTVSVAPQ